MTRIMPDDRDSVVPYYYRNRNIVHYLTRCMLHHVQSMRPLSTHCDYTSIGSRSNLSERSFDRVFMSYDRKPQSREDRTIAIPIRIGVIGKTTELIIGQLIRVRLRSQERIKRTQTITSTGASTSLNRGERYDGVVPYLPEELVRSVGWVVTV